MGHTNTDLQGASVRKEVEHFLAKAMSDETRYSSTTAHEPAQMTVRPTIQERAYQLAAECPSVANIRQRLKQEGYDSVESQLAAPTFRLALKRMCRKARRLDMQDPFEG
jgi:hypothetical protein